MKKCLFVISCLVLVLLTGCVSKQSLATALKELYDIGGAALVSDQINQYVSQGKLTQVQGDVLKNAAQKSYDQLQIKLKETNTADVEVDVDADTSKNYEKQEGK